jgi:glycosyltransferase involved in cell wall biosynthesis
MPIESKSPVKLSLIVPIYNESTHLEQFLAQLDTVALAADKELVFIDDCSKDKSFEILSNFKFNSKVIIERQPQNQGKGAAIRRGFELATGDIIGVQDADFEYSLDDIPAVIDPLLKGKADVVFGSRFKKNGFQVHRTFHYMVNRVLTIMSNILSGLYLTDMETCYKFFRADVLKNINLESNRFGFEPEITAKVARLKVRMMEVPISYFPRSYMEGKKITWKDGVAALRHIVYFNVLQKPSTFFKPGMPAKYIPQGTQWL